MITRIEIDGFKSFLDFELDVPPFLALVGPNAGGKSNLFDALEYLRLDVLGTEPPLLTARRGRPPELFHRVSKGRPVDHFTIAVEGIARTLWGWLPVRNTAGAELTDKKRESALPEHLGPVPTPVPGGFRVLAPEAVGRRGVVSEDELREAVSEFEISAHDAGEVAHTQARPSEVRTWSWCAPDPETMRRPAPAADDRPLTRTADNIAAVLGRCYGTAAFDDVMVDLAALVPDVSGVHVGLDEHRQEWSFDVVFFDEGPVPSTVLSNGTLRVLALLVALHDPKNPGTLFIEELENGLNPSRLRELLRRIQQRIQHVPADRTKPGRQVICTTHSPVVVSELYDSAPDALMFMETASRGDPVNDRVSRVTRALPVRADGEPGTYVSPRRVSRYLSAVEGSR